MQYGGIQAAIAGGTIECKHKMQIPLLKIIPSTALISFASLDPKYDFLTNHWKAVTLKNILRPSKSLYLTYNLRFTDQNFEKKN